MYVYVCTLCIKYYVSDCTTVVQWRQHGVIGVGGVSAQPAVVEAEGPGGEPVSVETLVLVDKQSILTAILTPALKVLIHNFSLSLSPSPLLPL